MQALVVNLPNPGDLRFVEDYPDPSAQRGEALVRVDLAGVCSTDLKIARGYMGFRGVPGHAFVGTVLNVKVLIQPGAAR